MGRNLHRVGSSQQLLENHLTQDQMRLRQERKRYIADYAPGLRQGLGIQFV